MILPRYRIAASLTPCASKGLPLGESLVRGLIIAGGDMDKVYKWNTVVATLAACTVGHAPCPRRPA